MRYNYLHSKLLLLLTWFRPLAGFWYFLPSSSFPSSLNSEGRCPDVLTIPLKECRRRIAWPYSRVLWPPPCAACGEGAQGSAWASYGPSKSRAAQEFWKTDYKENTRREAPKGFILEASGQSAGLWGGGRSVATAMQHPWERVCRARPLLQNGPCPGPARPRAVLPEKHVYERDIAYLPLKLLRSIQSEREEQMWCNRSLVTERRMGSRHTVTFCASRPCLQDTVPSAHSLQWVLFTQISPARDGSEIQDFKRATG